MQWGRQTKKIMLLFLVLIICSKEGWGWKRSSLRRSVAALGIVVSGLGSAVTQSPETALAGEFIDDKAKIQFSYSDDLGLVNSPKPLKTHEYEVLLKSETVKGCNVGITQDPVRIKSIVDFATPEGLGKKVIAVELAKEGVYTADVVQASLSTAPASQNRAYPSYDVEYKIDSSRGKNHYLIKATVVNSKLYVFTAQVKEANFKELEPKLREIMSSLKL